MNKQKQPPARDPRDIKTPGVADRLNAEKQAVTGGGIVIGKLGGIPMTAYPNQSTEQSAQPPAKYTIHPMALVFPPLPTEERAEMKESIRQFGLWQPIVVSDGKVVDGRNRYEICLELGIEPKTIDFAEYKKAAGVNLSIADFVFDSNTKRRHLTTSQRAAIAAELANMRQGERTDLEPSDNCLKVSQEEAAERLKVSSKSVSRAKKVKEKDPETFAKVKKGEVSLNTAIEKVEPPKEVPPPVATSTPSKKKPGPKPRSLEQTQWENNLESAKRALEFALMVQAEYQEEWDNMSGEESESERGSRVSDVCDLDLQDALDIIEEAAGIELP
jgi:hypothetical protein